MARADGFESSARAGFEPALSRLFASPARRSEAAIEEMTEESSTLASEIADLQDEIKALDKAVGTF